jgi:hypothetical protein
MNIQRDNVRKSRWSLVMQDYKSIREMILANQRVVEETGLQLFDVNTATIKDW